MTTRSSDLRLGSQQNIGEQLRFPGMESSSLPDPAAVIGEGAETITPPTFPGEPKVFKPEKGEMSPWERAELDREYVEIGKLVAHTRIETAEANAGIREREEHLKADHRDRDERRASELETERWNRKDRRVERYVMLGLFALIALASIALAFLTLDSDEIGMRITPSAPAAVAIIVGLRLRALSRSDRAESGSPGSDLRPIGSRL
jgi:hypothetical protein